ncbi:ankyrin repeat domain-containing protein [Sphingobacterium sp. WM]|uniref:ankyrin repeat domain-containing protein n=1 Tax=Sphingobacterium sp. WM TaxID=3031802 RepID=UPI00240E43FB|nr:ankyrin repeat domain-containing protein [Sphingobacterium sp. WM]WFB62080.1 ankyrin repeat domain-containing protein [Sphingobacterium sp. WM]
MGPEIESAVKRGDTVYLDKNLNLSNINGVNEQSQNLLMVTTYQHDYPMAAFLVKRGADPNQQDDLLNSPFLYAGSAGYLDLVKLYLAYGARFDVFNHDNETALISAAENGHVDVVRLLVHTKNYPINHINKKGYTALIKAIIFGDAGKDNVEIINLLLKGGADKDIVDQDGKTAIDYATQKGASEIIETLQMY